MRPLWWIWVWATLLPTTVYCLDTKPFSEPHIVESNKRAFEVLQMLKRADSCPGGYNPCSNEGNANACCREGTTCTKDSANNIACCSTGASCTGSLTGTKTASQTSGGSSGSFVFPNGATATTTEEGSGATHTGSTLSGPYPFVYVPTTISHSAECSSYYSLCQSEYTGCTQQLMGRYGVTVGGGAGTTVEAITASSQATSICSSLSAEACHGLSLGYCSAVETGGGGNAAGNNAALPGRTSSLQDLAFGLMIGVAGMFV